MFFLVPSPSDCRPKGTKSLSVSPEPMSRDVERFSTSISMVVLHPSKGIPFKKTPGHVGSNDVFSVVFPNKLTLQGINISPIFRHIWVDDFPNFPFGGIYVIVPYRGYKVSHITPYRKPIEIIIPKKFPEVWTRNEKTLEDSDTMIRDSRMDGEIHSQTKKQRKEIETGKTHSKKNWWFMFMLKKMLSKKQIKGFMFLWRIFFPWFGRRWTGSFCVLFVRFSGLYNPFPQKHEYSDTGHKLLTDSTGLENRSLKSFLCWFLKCQCAWVPYLFFFWL